MKRLVLFLVLALIFVRCNTVNNNDDFIIISPDKEIFFESEESSTKLIVNCNSSWTATNIPD